MGQARFNLEQVAKMGDVAKAVTDYLWGGSSAYSLKTAELVKSYILATQHSVAEGSIGTYQNVLNLFAKKFPHLPLNPEPIEQWLGTKSKRTANFYHGVLSRFYQFLNKRLGIPNVMEWVAKPKYKDKEADSLNLEQIRALLKRAENTREQLLLELYVGHGLRLSELIRLNIEDIGEDRIRIHGKRRTQPIPLLPETREGLIELGNGRSPSEPIFISRNKKRLSKHMVLVILKELYKKAGISGIKTTAHTLRHTFCTLMLEAGCDYGIVQKLMRHRGDMTSHYSHYNWDTLKKALELYSPIRLIRGNTPLQINANLFELKYQV
jgi:integrase